MRASRIVLTDYLFGQNADLLVTPPKAMGYKMFFS
jgi:hypothetical protein